MSNNGFAARAPRALQCLAHPTPVALYVGLSSKGGSHEL